METTKQLLASFADNRIQAARAWRENYAKRAPYNSGRHLLESGAAKALLVIVLTESTSDHLAEHDPQALKQAQQAIDLTSWEDYL